ncbi:hypothetical protein [Pseudarthrobacter cellobiosi]|nr:MULTISPECIES: hypothetical protein [unclassified Pseudarthrobacter]MCO4275884.1 hypothetical protein [Pseudarthrobacter sp. HLT3-5]
MSFRQRLEGRLIVVLSNNESCAVTRSATAGSRESVVCWGDETQIPLMID